jgi:glycosyltransferase involved in cell wall biosynthesis
MIVKNEAATIEQVLACAKTFCDELIVVDTGSTDNTVELAERMGAKVYHFEWVDDFSVARNFALSKCTGDWFIWLDADDTITEENQFKILQLKETVLSDALDGIFMPYRYAFNQAGACVNTIIRERLVRRVDGLQWVHPIHEGLILDANRCILRSDITIDHRPLPDKDIRRGGRNLHVLEKAMERGNNHPRTLYYHGLELRMVGQYERSIVSYLKYFEVCATQPEWEIYDSYIGIAESYKQLGKSDNSIQYLLKAVQLDSRRAEAFNHLGFIYMDREDCDKALPYFLAASNLQKPVSDGNINDQDYTWIPNDYASLCFFRLGNSVKAIEYALKGLSTHPNKVQLIKNLHAFVDGL